MGLEKAGGMGGDLKSSGHVDRTISQYARTLEAVKLSESTAKRWQRIARHWSLEALKACRAWCKSMSPATLWLATVVRQS